MDPFSSDLPKMVFKKAIPTDEGTISMTADMIRLLTALDGRKNMAQVSRELGMNLATMRSALTKLRESGLVEATDSRVPLVDRNFIDSVRRQMVMAVGPMGDLIIEDILGQMSLSLNHIPAHRAAELVGYLAREIPDEDKRAEFQKAIIKIIPR
jgi:transposase-like protein